MPKHVPSRMCIGCREMYAKKELMRIVQSDQELLLDKSGKKPGRGFYVCTQESCLEQIGKAKFLPKVLKRDLSAETKQLLHESLLAEAAARKRVQEALAENESARPHRLIKISRETAKGTEDGRKLDKR